MALALDDRRLAMLHELGLRAWLPAAPPSAQRMPAADAGAAPARPAPGSRGDAGSPRPLPEPAVREAGRPAHPPVAADPAAEPSPRAAPVPVPEGDVDWAGLATRVSACSACGLCQGRRAAVFQPEAQPRQVDWLVLGEPPDADEERAGTPFAGDAGRLLDNMLRAVGVQRDASGAAGARLSNVVRCRPSVPRNPEPAELAACAAHLWQEIAWSRPRVVLAMGRFAAQALLAESAPERATQPLGRLRGQVHVVRGVPVVVTHHPSRLLRAPADKAQAWADLCLARAVALGRD